MAHKANDWPNELGSLVMMCNHVNAPSPCEKLHLCKLVERISIQMILASYLPRYLSFTIFFYFSFNHPSIFLSVIIYCAPFLHFLSFLKTPPQALPRTVTLVFFIFGIFSPILLDLFHRFTFSKSSLFSLAIIRPMLILKKKIYFVYLFLSIFLVILFIFSVVR